MIYKCSRCTEPATLGTLCAKHTVTKALEGKPRYRGAHNRNFYGSAKWRSIRELVLSQQPLCACCNHYGIVKPAAEVDHIYPISHSPQLSAKLSNMQGLCKGCHSRKTQHEKRGVVYDYLKLIIIDLNTGAVATLK